MARAKRSFIDNGMYHILNRGNGKQDVFLKEGDYWAFKDALVESKIRFGVKLFAYCLMPNHFHFVGQCDQAKCYSEWMHWLTTTHAKRYLKHYGGSGHVWQGRFKSFLIQENEYFLTVLRYVEANPVRAGLVKCGTLWVWSSLAERCAGDPKGLVEKSPLALPHSWRDWVNQPMGDAELKSIRISTNRQVPYGRIVWRDEMCRLLGLESLLRPLGRPAK